MIRWALSLGLIGFVAAAFISMVFVVGIKPARYQSSIKPDDMGIKYERLTTYTDDGVEIVGWFLPHATSKAVIIVGHGYPFDKGNILKKTVFLNEAFNLLYFDFRYFGESEGQYTTFGIKERLDIKAVLEYLNKREDIDPALTGFFGYSLSAAAFIQANPKQAKVMVLDAPFISLQAMLEDVFKWLIGPLKWPFVKLTGLYGEWFLHLSIKDASAISFVGKLQMPVLFIHGDQDKQIPVWHSKKLFAKCQSSDKELWIIPGADHDQRSEVIQKVYEKKVMAFFKKWLNTKNGE